VDIGLEWVDVAWYDQDKLQHVKLPNTLPGFKELIKRCGKEVHYVMESTGPYYVGFAMYLDQKGIRVSVVNALVIKRFIQMHL
jgi:transposase